MRRSPLTTVILIILSCTLTGCSLSLPPPSPQKLLSVFTQSFTCGFSVDDGSGGYRRASLVRSASGDTLTAYGDSTDTVFFHNGIRLTLKTRGSADQPPLILDLPDGSSAGLPACLPLFSVLPDDSFSAERSDGGITVTGQNGRYRAVFSPQGIPCRITLDGITAVIDSFAVTEVPAQ